MPNTISIVDASRCLVGFDEDLEFNSVLHVPDAAREKYSLLLASARKLQSAQAGRVNIVRYPRADARPAPGRG